jgi:hypothetical protein
MPIIVNWRGRDTSSRRIEAIVIADALIVLIS